MIDRAYLTLGIHSKTLGNSVTAGVERSRAISQDSRKGKNNVVHSEEDRDASRLHRGGRRADRTDGTRRVGRSGTRDRVSGTLGRPALPARARRPELALGRAAP